MIVAWYVFKNVRKKIVEKKQMYPADSVGVEVRMHFVFVLMSCSLQYISGYLNQDVYTQLSMSG